MVPVYLRATGILQMREEQMIEREKINSLDNIDKTVEELSQVFKDRPDLVCLAIEYLYFA